MFPLSIASFSISVTNPTDDTLKYTFNTSCQFAYQIDDFDSKHYFGYFHAFTNLTLPPHSTEFRTMDHQPEYYKLYPGIHYVTAELKNIAYSDTITISVNPPSAYGDPDDFVHTTMFETDQFLCGFLNDGRLDYNYGIQWPKSIEVYHHMVFQHGLWLFGYRNDSLISATSYFLPGYTPGPIINGRAGILEMPDDRFRFRSYLLTASSGPGDPDYDEWPSQWGAPVNPDGTPKLFGDVIMWTVYNDAHPDIHSPDFEPVNQINTFFEVRETVWGYNQAGTLGDALFFKWQIYNKSDAMLDSVVICHWNDIDIGSIISNHLAYNVENEFGYAYDHGSRYEGEVEIPPIAASYVLLQGPVIPKEGSTGYSFGHRIADHRNLETTGFWAIGDDSASDEYFLGCPHNIQQAYYFITGRRHDGTPIINPVTGEKTSYTFTGDPISGEGWINILNNGGMAGYMVSSGPITMAPGDSQEVVFALVGAIADTLPDAITGLRDKVIEIQKFYDTNLKSEIEKQADVPAKFHLAQNYPNPFNASTVIRYEIPKRAFTTLRIYNLKGQLVETIVNRSLPAGSHQIYWNPGELPSGMYFYRIESDNVRLTHKCLILK